MHHSADYMGCCAAYLLTEEGPRAIQAARVSSASALGYLLIEVTLGGLALSVAGIPADGREEHRPRRDARPLIVGK